MGGLPLVVVVRLVVVVVVVSTALPDAVNENEHNYVIIDSIIKGNELLPCLMGAGVYVLATSKVSSARGHQLSL